MHYSKQFVENDINLVLSSLKIKLFEDHSDTASRSDSNSSIHFLDFSVLNVCTGWNH